MVLFPVRYVMTHSAAPFSSPSFLWKNFRKETACTFHSTNDWRNFNCWIYETHILRSIHPKTLCIKDQRTIRLRDEVVKPWTEDCSSLGAHFLYARADLMNQRFSAEIAEKETGAVCWWEAMRTLSEEQQEKGLHRDFWSCQSQSFGPKHTHFSTENSHSVFSKVYSVRLIPWKEISGLDTTMPPNSILNVMIAISQLPTLGSHIFITCKKSIQIKEKEYINSSRSVRLLSIQDTS